MIIKIVELGKAVKEVAVEGSIVDVNTIAEIAGIVINEATINGYTVTGSTSVRDGDVIFLNPKKIKGNNDFIEVKFVKFGAAGGGIDTVAVAPGSTIADAVAAAGKSYDGFEFRVGTDTTASETSKVLNSSTSIILVKKIKGNNDFIEVKFVKFGAAGGGIDTVAVAPGSTIADAVTAAGKSYDGFEFRVGTDTTASETSKVLNSSTSIFLVKKIKGNN
jgi:hypothetical protein